MNSKAMVTRPVSRRKLIRFLMGGAVAAAYPFYIEPRWLDLTESHVRLPRISFTRPVRILQLSDLHASPFVPLSMIEHAVEVGLAQHPDVICLTGDYITGEWKGNTGAYIRILRRLSSSAPTFAVMGNHDGGAWMRRRGGYSDHSVVENLLSSSAIEILHNRSSRLRLHGAALTLVGVGDLWAEELNSRQAFSGVRHDEPVVLLSHNPDSKDALASQRWDLMLSGHTHGGQVAVPFAGAVYVPVADRRYVSGLKPWNDRQIYVSRGVGNLRGLRFYCRPEVTLITVG